MYVQKPKVPWLKMATSLPVWAVCIAHFTNNWGYYTLLTCLPMYLKNILHFDMKSVSTTASGVLGGGDTRVYGEYQPPGFF